MARQRAKLQDPGRRRMTLAQMRAVLRLPPPPPIYFWSGTHAIAKLRAHLDEKIPVGIAIQECSKRCWSWIKSNASDQRLRLFVDSGAYSEWTGIKKGKDSISISEWKTRYANMATLAETMGGRLYVVLPDKIGDERESLNRMKHLAPYVLRIIHSGARALLPIQKKNQNSPVHADYYVDKVMQVLNDVADLPVERDQLIPSIPMPAKAYSEDQIIKVIDQLQPTRIHLLGTSPDKSEHLLNRIRQESPSIEISLDSVGQRQLTAFVQGGAPLPITQARYHARGQIDPQLLVRDGIDGPPRLDVITRILSRTPVGDLDKAVAKLVALVHEFEPDRAALPGGDNLRAEARAFLQGRVPGVWGYDITRAWRQGQLSTVNWGYYVNKVGEMVLAQRIGPSEYRSRTHSSEATYLAFRRILSRRPPHWDEDFGDALKKLSPKQDGTYYTIDELDQSLLYDDKIRYFVPDLNPYGIRMIARSILYRMVSPRWLTDLLGRRGRGRRFDPTWAITPHELELAIVIRAKLIQREHPDWTFSSDKLLGGNPANDPRWFALEMER